MPPIHDIRPLVEAEYNAWDHIVDCALEGTIFHSTQWLNAVARVTRSKVGIYGMFINDNLVGGIPLAIRSKGPITIGQRAFATPYSGVIMNPNYAANEHMNLESVERFISKTFSMATLTSSPYARHNHFAKFGQHKERSTYVLNISSTKAVWKGFASELRNRIRKAQKAGVTVSAIDDASVFFHLYQETFARQGIQVPIEESRFVEFIHTLQSKGIGQCFLAVSKEGAPCAAALMMHDRKRVYESLTASDSQLRNNGSVSLLMWEVIQHYSPSHDELDLGGANIASIKRFKKKFRGQLRMYQETRNFRTWIERVLLNLYLKSKG